MVVYLDCAGDGCVSMFIWVVIHVKTLSSLFQASIRTHMSQFKDEVKINVIVVYVEYIFVYV